MTTYDLSNDVLILAPSFKSIHNTKPKTFCVRVLDRTSGEYCAYTNLDGKTAFAVALRIRKGSNPSLVTQVWHGPKKSGTEVARYAGDRPDYKGLTKHSTYPF